MRRRLVPLFLILLLTAAGVSATLATGSSPELGLDLQGGVSVVLEPTTEPAEGALDQAVAIIRNRVDALGVAEPEITRQGDAIIVQIPGVEQRDRVLELVGTTAELRFRPVLSAVPADTVDVAEADDAEAGVDAEPGDDAEAGVDAEPGDDAEAGDDAGPGDDAEAGDDAGPADDAEPIEVTPPEEDDPDEVVILEDKDGEFVYTLGPTLATGRVVESATASIDPFGVWEVPLVMRAGEAGIDLFNNAAAQCNPPTQTCPTGQLGIVLDSEVQSAPTIQAPRYERDQIVITGEFTESEARDLALVLRYGALPVELERQTVQTVSATLGEDSLRAGVIAGLVGLVLVALYMMLYYRALGLVVILGLGIWAGLLYAVISWLGVTQGLALTLAGVTGIIISVGMAVDSYVVYFERLKEEVTLGRTLRSSAERAFKRAFRTILAANIATFIGAAVLWWLTVGPVRGFAFFLGLATVLGVLVTWFYTRPIVIWLARSRFFSEARAVGVGSAVAAPPSASPIVGGGR